MPKKCLVIAAGFLWMPLLLGQQQQPQVKVNMLNVCSPSAGEQQEIKSALARIPLTASFTQDFEIDRGRSLLDQSSDVFKLEPAGPNANAAADAGISDWVRIRREYPSEGYFATVQYSFSKDRTDLVETLVFRVRDPKELLLVSIEDSASAVTSAANMLSTDTPASRIKLERFGQPSIVLARCRATDAGPAPDQSAYEPLFHSASVIAANYRDLLDVRHTVPMEMERIGKLKQKRNPVLKPVAPERKPQ